MQYPVFMRVLHSAGQLRDEFHRVSDRDRSLPDYFVKLPALDEIHAEVAATIALPDFMNGNDEWMIEAGSGFRFSPKALQMRLSSPRSQANYFERDNAIEAFLPRSINYALTTTTDFFQQFVVAKVCQHFNRTRIMALVRQRR